MALKAASLNEPVKRIIMHGVLARKYAIMQRQNPPPNHKDVWFLERGLKTRKN